MISKVIIHYKHNSVVSLIAWLLRNVFRSQTLLSDLSPTNWINNWSAFMSGILICRWLQKLSSQVMRGARLTFRNFAARTTSADFPDKHYKRSVKHITNESGRHARTIKRAVLDQPEIKIEDRVMIMIDSDSNDRVYIICLWADLIIRPIIYNTPPP